jgi:glycine cleavage system H protein
MSRIKFTEDHEWLLLDEDGNFTVGITDYAQEQLGDIVFVELPEIGAEIIAGDEAAVVESVKAAGDIRAPINGTICDINEILADAPEKVNSDPMGEGWFFKITPMEMDEIDGMMDEDAYWDYIAGL